MGLWRWLTGRLSVTQGIEKWRAIYGHDADSGESVSADAAYKLSAWWSSVRLKSETISTLPCGTFVREGDDRKPMPGHPLYTILHDRPNDEQTPVEFWTGRVAALCTLGNSFAEKRFIGDRLVSLQPMPASDVVVTRRPSDNALIYKFTERGKVEELPAAKVFHIKGFTPNDEDEGLSPVAYAARSLGGALAVERASARIYSRGLRAQGFFAAPVDMNEQQRKDFITNYVKPGEGATGEGKTLIFPPGFDWKNMNITPRDAEMVLSRGVSVEDIARWMQVPPILIGHASPGQTMWGSGVEQIILGWLVLGLRAELKRIESAVNTRLLTREDQANGVSFEFNFEGLLRADSAARAALMATLAQNGLRTRNELRRIDHYPKMAGADDLTAQSNLVTLDRLGAQQADAEVVRNALRNWLTEERKAA